MTDPILPSADRVLTPAIDAIVSARPETLRHFNNPDSNWATLPSLWRAQLLLCLARLADEAKGARLRFSRGQALRALAASEFETTLPSEAQAAYATVTLTRPTPTAGPGVIRTDQLFRMTADPEAVPLPVRAATYAPVRPVYVSPNALSVVVQLRANTAGVDANVPAFSNYATSTRIQPAAPLFDRTLAVTSCSAAGGSSGLPDPVLVAACRAFATGRFGPTMGALLAGLLRQQSVRRFALFPAGALPYAMAYIADESWSSNDAWVAAATQTFVDGFLGFGSRVRFGQVVNRQIALSATIALASSDDLNDTSDIDDAVRAAAAAYFDDRPDWYRWRSPALRSALARADGRIQQCSAVAITDAVTGAAIADSTGVFGQTFLSSLTHLFLTGTGIQVTYTPPL